jgi:hypothetical protein
MICVLRVHQYLIERARLVSELRSARLLAWLVQHPPGLLHRRIVVEVWRDHRLPHGGQVLCRRLELARRQHARRHVALLELWERKSALASFEVVKERLALRVDELHAAVGRRRLEVACGAALHAAHCGQHQWSCPHKGGNGRAVSEQGAEGANARSVSRAEGANARSVSRAEGANARSVSRAEGANARSVSRAEGANARSVSRAEGSERVTREQGNKDKGRRAGGVRGSARVVPGV